MTPEPKARRKFVDGADAGALDLLRRLPDDAEVRRFVDQANAKLGQSDDEKSHLAYPLPGSFDALLTLDPIALSWLRDIATVPGFCGYPTYPDSFSAFEDAAAKGRQPVCAPAGAYDPTLLEIGRTLTRLHLDIAAYARHKAPLSGADRRWPRIASKDVERTVGRIPVQYLARLLRELEALAQQMLRYIEATGRGVQTPPPPARDRSRVRVDLTKEVCKYIKYIDTLSFVIIPKPLDHSELQPLDIQVTELREQATSVLAAVGLGQPYRIKSQQVVKALLLPVPDELPRDLERVAQRVLQRDASDLANRARSGEIFLVLHGDGSPAAVLKQVPGGADDRQPSSPIDIHVRELRSRAGKVLDDVEHGATFAIHSKRGVQAFLRRPTADSAVTASVARADFAKNPGHYVSTARDGATVEILHGADPARRVILVPAPDGDHPAEATDDERRDMARERMRLVRERSRTPEELEVARERAKSRDERLERKRALVRKLERAGLPEAVIEETRQLLGLTSVKRT